jgi:hypothetical protein
MQIDESQNGKTWILLSPLSSFPTTIIFQRRRLSLVLLPIRVISPSGRESGKEEAPSDILCRPCLCRVLQSDPVDGRPYLLRRQLAGCSGPSACQRHCCWPWPPHLPLYDAWWWCVPGKFFLAWII